MEYIVGEMYFCLKYYDDFLCLPSIEPLLYLGKNLQGFHEGKIEDELYFQRLEDVHNNGCILAGKGKRIDSFDLDCEILVMSLERLNEQLLLCIERQRKYLMFSSNR
ncbi:hypothetical protein LOS73_04670 [Pseudoalteromonas sp. SCSIO 43210]|uniref:hypothetical protein n=1 Tax=Pseudoalteromonas sp. BSi20495 TaxID=386429 RepID=UPI000518E037|nr:hypothetical protein [Pseudoalteromonas sp. BSi20495]